jgi:hypothetical protein
MSINVKQLRELLAGLPDDMPIVFINDPYVDNSSGNLLHSYDINGVLDTADIKFGNSYVHVYFTDETDAIAFGGDPDGIAMLANSTRALVLF